MFHFVGLPFFLFFKIGLCPRIRHTPAGVGLSAISHTVADFGFVRIMRQYSATVWASRFDPSQMYLVIYSAEVMVNGTINSKSTSHSPERLQYISGEERR